MIVLDANVVSGLMRPSANPQVLAWFDRVNATDLATTSITVAEIEFGLARLPDGVRADGLREAASALWTAFASSILPFETSAAIEYGRIVAHRERIGPELGQTA